MAESPLICFVTPGHLASNPRLVKEAIAAELAGYRIAVVFSQYMTELVPSDDSILSRHPSWHASAIDWTSQTVASRRLRRQSGLRQRIASLFFGWTPRRTVGGRALTRVHDELLDAACRVRANLYIAHNVAALPIAAAAAAPHAQFAFDAEDFHRGELAHSRASARQRALIEWAEREYMPRCSYLSAASDGIADAYARCLGVSRPTTILNVFSRIERDVAVPEQLRRRERQGGRYSLYWFSQTIGAGRGLEDVVDALAHLGDDVHLHVRGMWAAGYERELRGRARALGVEHRLHALATVDPHYLVRLTAQHDVGLALEQPVTENRMLCLTNKLYTYLLAGLPVAASDTPGQRDAARDIPGAVGMYHAGRPDELAAAIQRLLADPASGAVASAAAETRFNWEVESERFLTLVHSAIGPARSDTVVHA
jgi:glycosyltransferase involved in cell wall biosynthesis